MAGHSYSSRGASFVPEWWEKGVPDGIKAGTLMPVLFRLFCENVFERLVGLCPLSTQEGSFSSRAEHPQRGHKPDSRYERASEPVPHGRPAD